jgi:hypothetical protein
MADKRYYVLQFLVEERQAYDISTELLNRGFKVEQLPWNPEEAEAPAKRASAEKRSYSGKRRGPKPKARSRLQRIILTVMRENGGKGNVKMFRGAASAAHLSAGNVYRALERLERAGRVVNLGSNEWKEA